LGRSNAYSGDRNEGKTILNFSGAFHYPAALRKIGKRPDNAPLSGMEKLPHLVLSQRNRGGETAGGAGWVR